jgi:DNA-binding response OmpR family regulator
MSGTFRVRLIEDHDALREATVTVLQQAGFDVMGFSCAEDLIDTPNALGADAYVIDLNLPGDDGLSLAVRLRKTEPTAVIVITTARSHLNDRVKGYEVGANLYMPKPFDAEELVAALRALIGQRSAGKGSAKGLRLDLASRRVSGPTGEVRLADAEVRLLVAIAAAKDQTLERWQVAVQINPGKDDISADNLQNRLSQLRKKIQGCGVDGEILRATRGVGYTLCVPLVVV